MYSELVFQTWPKCSHERSFLFEKHYYHVNLVDKLQQNRTDKNVTNISDKRTWSTCLCPCAKQVYVVKAEKYVHIMLPLLTLNMLIKSISPALRKPL